MVAVADLKVLVAHYLRFRLDIKNGPSRPGPNGFNSAKISHHMHGSPMPIDVRKDRESHKRVYTE